MYGPGRLADRESGGARVRRGRVPVIASLPYWPPFSRWVIRQGGDHRGWVSVRVGTGRGPG